MPVCTPLCLYLKSLLDVIIIHSPLRQWHFLNLKLTVLILWLISRSHFPSASVSKPGVAGTQWAFYVGNENSNGDIQVYKGIDAPTP